MRKLKAITRHDYAKRMNMVLEYIQHHLDDHLSLQKLASIACFSPFHFHRVFRGMVGESVKAYVRRMRLQRAAGWLKYGDRDVTTIAFDSGFETHESFTRAFGRMYSVSPLSFRKACQVDIQTKQIDYWKEITMEAEIVTLAAMDVAYRRHIGPYQECTTAWKTLCDWAGPKGLFQNEPKILGLSYDDPQVTPAEKIRYDACIELKEPIEIPEEENAENQIAKKRLPEGRYAKAIHRGPYDGLADSYAQLCGQWVPQNNHEFDDKPSIEIYLNSPEDTAPGDLLTEIYVAVK